MEIKNAKTKGGHMEIETTYFSTRNTRRRDRLRLVGDILAGLVLGGAALVVVLALLSV